MQTAAQNRINLSRARIPGVDLSSTDLSGADLSYTDLSGADLSNTRLHGANLKDSILKGTLLVGADLTDPKNYTREQLAEAVTDETTVLPAYLASDPIRAATE